MESLSVFSPDATDRDRFELARSKAHLLLTEARSPLSLVCSQRSSASRDGAREIAFHFNPLPSLEMVFSLVQTQRSLLGLALDLHYFNPKIETFHHVAEQALTRLPELEREKARSLVFKTS